MEDLNQAIQSMNNASADFYNYGKRAQTSSYQTQVARESNVMAIEQQRAAPWSQRDRRNTNQPIMSSEVMMNTSGKYPRTGPAIVA